MKLLLIILSFLFAGLSVFSQGAFHLKRNLPYDSEIIDIAECEKGYLLVGGYSNNGTIGGYLLFLDKSGNEMWEKVISGDSINQERSFLAVTYDKGYFYIGGIRWVEGKEFGILTKVDSDGNIISQKKIGQESHYAYDNHIVKIVPNNNGVLVASSGFNNGKTEGELIQMDLEGNVLWNKFYSYDSTSMNYYEHLEDLKEGKDGNFVMKLKTENFDIQFSYQTIIKISPDGKEIWRKIYNTLKPSALTEDSMYLMATTPYKEDHVLAYFVVNTPVKDVPARSDFAFIEYDKYGNELNYKRFYNPSEIGSSDIYTNRYNEIYLAGSKDFIDSTRLSIIKFNPNWEVMWDKLYHKQPLKIVDTTYTPPGEVFDCGMLTSDNGFMMSGSDSYMINGKVCWNSTIVKTDCNGNTVWDYGSCLSPDFEDVTIFPNPSSNNFIIQLPNVHEKDDIQLKVYDITGKLVSGSDYTGSEVINLNSSSWATGTYICRIAINNVAVKTEKLIKM